MASDPIMETDVQYVMTRKRKRSVYNSPGNGALDFLHSGISMGMPELSIDLIPPIVTPSPARDTTTTKEAVTVDGFIRRMIAGVPGPLRKRKLRTVRLQDTPISADGANNQPATRPANAKANASNGSRISNKPVGDGKPMTLAQRLARAAILSHVETKENLNPPGTSSSRRPLNFVSFPKFATPPSSPRKKIIKRSALSRSESTAVMLRNHRRQRTKRQPTFERPGYPPLPMVPLHEAKAADASGVRSHSESTAVTLDSSRRKRLKKQPTDEAEAAYAAFFPRSSKRRPIDRHGYPPLKFVPAHEAEAGHAAMFSRSSKPRPTTDRHGYPPLKFVPTHEAEAGRAAMFPRSSKPQPTTDRHGYPPLNFI
ncbi:hypothetical protein EDD22DRAFT_890373 [Suillus occidentalis]|nr:hypothetical protein EDD22DRAFT_890373 [Suillus occidentalis]